MQAFIDIDRFFGRRRLLVKLIKKRLGKICIHVIQSRNLDLLDVGTLLQFLQHVVYLVFVDVHDHIIGSFTDVMNITQFAQVV